MQKGLMQTERATEVVRPRAWEVAGLPLRAGGGGAGRVDAAGARRGLHTRAERDARISQREPRRRKGSRGRGRRGRGGRACPSRLPRGLRTARGVAGTVTRDRAFVLSARAALAAFPLCEQSSVRHSRGERPRSGPSQGAPRSHRSPKARPSPPRPSTAPLCRRPAPDCLPSGRGQPPRPTRPPAVPSAFALQSPSSYFSPRFRSSSRVLCEYDAGPRPIHVSASHQMIKIRAQDFTAWWMTPRGVTTHMPPRIQGTERSAGA